MTPAKKAALTRAGRKELRDAYGNMTYDVLSALLHENLDPVDNFYYTSGTVAAIKAHLTRGTYDWVLNSCNFKRW